MSLSNPFKRFFARVLPALVVAISAAAMLGATQDALAKRLGGGSSLGRQSSNVTQRQALPPSGANPGSVPAAPAAAPAQVRPPMAAPAPRSGMSRWLGPIAGIAAGLGLAALLSHFGLGEGMAEMMGSLLLIALAIFAVLYLVRRFSGAAARPALQGAASHGYAAPPAPVAFEAQQPVASVAAPVQSDGSWGVAADFDSAGFLHDAKEFFVKLQGIWDRADAQALHDLVTDDLQAELIRQIEQTGGKNQTEVVLLNAELLGIETVGAEHLASVRFSGMLREAPGAEAFRFEEVWNFLKGANHGWLLAGVQQVTAPA